MSKQCKPSQVWIIKNQMSANPKFASMLLWEWPVGNGEHGYVQVPDEDLIITFGDVIPDENQACLVTTEERETWCEMCQKWSDLGCCDYNDVYGGTKSRCRVLETIKLEEADDKRKE